MVWLTLLVIVVLCLLLYVARPLSNLIFRSITLQKLPGPPMDDVILGNTKALFTSPDEIFKVLRKWGRQYYPIYKMWVLQITACNLLSPEDIELVLSSSKHLDKSRIYDLLLNWLRTGLLTSKGKKWHTRRKILTPAFHFNILRQFVETFNEETESLVDNLRDECRKPYTKVNSNVIQFTLKSIAETAMGTKLEFKTEAERIYKKSILEIGEIYLDKLLRPWLISNLVYFFTSYYRKEMKLVKTLHKFTTDIIQERQRNFTGYTPPNDEDEVYSSRKRLAMLDLLLSAKIDDGAIDDEGIREEVDTFMFEGHDTTATAICFAFMVLACNKEAQDKIVDEMTEVLGDIHKKPTYNDLQELKFMERCVKEVLRLYPSVPFVSRTLGEDLVTASGYHLPKESMVHIHVYDLHHNPDIYPDPEKFDPDRFLPENCQERHPFAYLPFSAGPRNCIGQRFALLELKTVLCGVLANFVLEPVDTPSTIVLITDLILRTKDDIRVKFVPR